MELLHPRCGGLDIHKETVVARVRHLRNGKVTKGIKTFKTTTEELIALSDWLATEGSTHIVMEATGVYWKPVWHILSDAEFELVLANAGHFKNVPGRKTDVKDAAWLAELMAHGLVKASFVPDQPIQQMRDLLRTRKQRWGDGPYIVIGQYGGQRIWLPAFGHCLLLSERGPGAPKCSDVESRARFHKLAPVRIVQHV
jgi:hypothetical protein